MLTSVMIIAIVVVSLVGYWWLGQVWPDSKDLQQRIHEHRSAARAMLRPRLPRSRTPPPDGRPWD